MERHRLAQDHHRTVIPRRQRLPRLALGIALLRAAVAPFPTQAESLPDALRQYLHQPAFQHATWGVTVQDAASGTLLFETNQHRLLKPASTAKLFTGALALHALGPDSRLATELIPTGTVSTRGVLHGDLLVHGGGDFSLASRFVTATNPPRSTLDPVVATLKQAGLRRVNGDLVADDSQFFGVPFGNGWTRDDLQYSYGAEVSALSLDDNVLEVEFAPGPAAGDPVMQLASTGASYFEFITRNAVTSEPGTPRDVRVRRDPGSRIVHITGSIPVGSGPWKDSVTIPQPALYFVHRLREELIAAGIQVRGTVRHEPGARQRQLATATAQAAGSRPPSLYVLSPPVSSLVTAMMKPSQNLYAQLLLLQVGSRFPHPGTLSTEEAGIDALQSFVEQAGIPREEVQLDDGSGLSRSSLVTPAALVALLRHMDSHPQRKAFLDSLPIAGRDGSLRQSFRGTALEGNLRAKTGSLRYVHTLSGFVTNTGGQRLVFAAMLNAYAPASSQPPAPSGRDALEGLVRRLAEATLPAPP
jgi:D-alanyl-D-alanine carboxypeptidase/D-alanyl-D-alanine-endopeptidase (penicillin-binding protein 4)